MLKRMTFLWLCAFFSLSSLQTAQARSEPGQVKSKPRAMYRGRINPPTTVLLNLLPLPGLGIGSFVQGDIRTGMLVMGSTTVGVTLLMMGVSQQFFSALDTQPGSDGTRPFPLTPSVLPLMFAGGALLTFSIVWSVVAPLKYGWIQNQPSARPRSPQPMMSLSSLD